MQSMLRIAIVFGVFLAAFQEQEVCGQSTIQSYPKVSSASSNASSVQTILETLGNANISGSLEFTGHCNSLDYPDFPDFPRVRASANTGGDALVALRKSFASDPLMHVTQDTDGTIRMIERGVPADVLKFKVGHISFVNERGGIYNANAALNFLLWSPDMKNFMETHNIRLPFEGGPISALFGSKPTAVDPPHIYGDLDNVSVADSLDRILKVFPGLWIYENCPQTNKRRRIVYFRFYSLRGNLN
ncbi:MAG: hypothetical protein P4L87_11305 [Formivibrio sp.]|nr:hypothetical protein [Formivibrio sp.]